jgi:hypothetical protein
MAKYHINPETGNANVCTAKVKCKFTSSDGVEPPHYGTKLDAQKAAEEQLSSTLPTIQSLKNTVEIQEPKGDPRGAHELRQDIVAKMTKLDELERKFSSELTDFRLSLEKYDAVAKGGVKPESKKFEEVYTTANLAIRQAGMTRKTLLTNRSQLNEDTLLLEQKLYPGRAKERAAVLDALDPKTQQGDELLRSMKKVLDDSNKELELSKRATDNLVNRHENGRSEGSTALKTAFAQTNDSLEQSERLINHARAVKNLSELAKMYEGAEALHWRGRVKLDPLKATIDETAAADSLTPSQIETYTRVTNGLDQNTLNERYMKTLDAQRKGVPTGTPEREEMNTVIKRHRDNIKYNQTQYSNSIGRASDTNYRGFISLR